MVEAFPIGEDEARTLFDRHAPEIYRFVLLTTQNASLASDVTQETFIRAFRSYHTYDPSRPIEPWLHRIASNVSRTLLTRTSRRPPRDIPRDQAFAESPETAWLTGEERRELWQALSKLTAPQREIIVLHFYKDLALGVCAEVIGVPVGTAKSRLHAALTKLRSVYPEKFTDVERRGVHG